MPRARFKYHQKLEVEPALSTSLPAPTLATDGAAVPTLGDASWDAGGNGRSQHVMFLIEAAGALTLTGPVNVWGYNTADDAWYLAATLNDGNDIVFAGATKAAFVAEWVSGFDRLAVACAVTASSVTISAVPIV